MVHVVGFRFRIGESAVRLIEKLETRKQEHILKRQQILGVITDVEGNLKKLRENICAFDGAIEEIDRACTDIRMEELAKAEEAEAEKRAKREAKCQQSKTQ